MNSIAASIVVLAGAIVVLAGAISSRGYEGLVAVGGVVMIGGGILLGLAWRKIPG